MSVCNCSSVPLQYILVIIIYNLISNINCLDISIENNLSLKNFTVLNLNFLNDIERLDVLPKDHIFTGDEISNYTKLYLAGKKNEDIYLNGTQLIQKYGYKVEEHHVKTSDGYILAMFRIPSDGPVVFLMHGFLNSFVDWLTVGPDQALPYLLANLGYDVWMGNARGNTFSKKHERLSPSDPEFWEFSLNEIGSFDLPAMIDYVLTLTGQQKLTYLGFSQGTTAFFILCSTKPDYNDKIDFMIALSALAWMKHTRNPILQLASVTRDYIYVLARILGLNEIAPDNNLTKAITLTLCGDAFLATIFCQNVVFLITGFSYSQTNYYQLPVIYNHVPSGASIMQLNHDLQLIASGYFRNYDYGAIKNLNKYGSVAPPSYPVDKITVPIAIFQSEGDWITSTIDVNKLRSKLKNVVDYYEVPLSTFNHVDYLWAKDVKKLIYDKVLALINQYSTKL